MKTSIEIPLFIIRKSKKYYQNTITGQYIRAEHLQTYIENNRKKDSDKQVKLF